MTYEVANFTEAVEEDEYAELELPTGDILITDWEGDGEFFPYVEPHTYPSVDRERKHFEEREMEIAEAIEEQFGHVKVHHIEYDSDNDVFYPSMDRPEI